MKKENLTRAEKVASYNKRKIRKNRRALWVSL